MGSLPNLHELEEAERKREKRREYELLLEQRARDTSRERERLSIFAQQRKVSTIDRSIKLPKKSFCAEYIYSGL